MKRRKLAKPPKSAKIVFDQSKEVRAIARERVGIVKPSKPILPKAERRKPKHKKSPGDDASGG